MARSGPALALSLVVHAALLGGLLARARTHAPADAPPRARLSAPAVLARMEGARRAMELREERAALVRQARADLAAGRLALGRFLLAASRIDAEATGIELDSALAEARYAERVAALRAALAPRAGVAASAPRAGVTAPAPRTAVAEAVASVFADLKYHGRPGGLMASALVDGGGSCEQVAQLVAAAVYDAGRPAEIALRYYGGLMEDGAAHLTPVVPAKDGELDLMTGRPAAPGGARVAPEDLVEVYARVHGLAPALGAERPSASRDVAPSNVGAAPRAAAPAAVDGAGGASSPASAAAAGAPPAAAGAPPAAAGAPPAAAGAPSLPAPAGPPRPTLVAGFPPNADRFPGALPLYAARAIRDPSSDPAPDDADTDPVEVQAKHCAFFLRIAMLAPPTLDVLIGGGAGVVQVEPRRVPVPMRLEREAVLLRAAETFASRPATDPIDRLMSWACVAVLGDAAAVDFALAREPGLAAEAVEAGKRGRERGKAALAAVAWSGAEGALAARTLAVEYGGRSWILLGLDGGERVVMDLALHATRDNWGRTSALAAVVVWPGTREHAVAYVSTLSPTEQVAVMHEVFHAHDHMPPWTSTFDLSGTPASSPAAARFLAVYRVFRGLAWRLWEAKLPVADTLAALGADARAAGIGRGWEAALLEYFANNVLNLHAQREGGKAVVALLREAVAANPADALDPLRRRLTYLEAQAKLDPRTIADAMRLP